MSSSLTRGTFFAWKMECFPLFLFPHEKSSLTGNRTRAAAVRAPGRGRSVGWRINNGEDIDQSHSWIRLHSPTLENILPQSKCFQSPPTNQRHSPDQSETRHHEGGRLDVDGDIAQSLVNAMRSVGANLAVILIVLTHL